MLSRTLYRYAWKFCVLVLCLGYSVFLSVIVDFLVLSTDHLVYFMKSLSVFLVNSCAVSSRLFEMIISKLYTSFNTPVQPKIIDFLKFEH